MIDLQAAQSPGTRHRGIGRYSLALARAMIRHAGAHEILIALNGALPETIPPLREMFTQWLPDSAIRVWHGTCPPQAVAGASQEQRRAAEIVREAFFAGLRPDWVHISSLFDSAQYVTTGVARGAFRAPTAVTLYDLIPHIYPGLYLPLPQAALEYAEKIEHLKRADLCLAISESSRREGIDLLGLDPRHVVNISSAADLHFTPEDVPAGRADDLRRRLGLERPFVMYTGGIDHRKNVEGLIGAWAALPAAVRSAHQLAIVCAILPEDRARLQSLAAAFGLEAGDVVLTGFVAEGDLVDLYRLCKLFVFASRHEGFGLPALEAMRCGAPVIGADNSSIPEVIGRQDALFDAASTAAIAAKIEQVLGDDNFRAGLARHGLEHAQRFSWDESARRALAAMEANARPQPVRAPRPSSRPRLALVSPMPPQRSGIADASAAILPALAAHYDVDVVLAPNAPQPESVEGVKAWRDAAWFRANGAQYDRVLYQFGNSDYHEYMFDLLETHPGTVVLHDFFISGLVAHREFHRDAPAFWTGALYASHGWQAVAERFRAKDLGEVVFAYPANFPVLAAARGVIVHSEYALRLACEWYGPHLARDWSVVPLARVPAAARDRGAARARLGIAAGDFVVCSFGLLGPIKLNHRLLRAWRASPLDADASCRLVYVGEVPDSDYGRSFSAELAQAPGRVSVTGWADSEHYADWLAAADIAVQLRGQSRGETSAAVLDCMNHGLATIANREGSMADLDTQAVWLLPQEFADEELARALEALWRDPARRREMGQRAATQVHESHAPQACAAGYAQAIEQHAARAGVPELARELAPLLAQPGQEGLTAALARAAALNLPLPRPARRLFIDVSGHGTLPPLVLQLIAQPAAGWRVEPVFHAGAEWRFARHLTLGALGGPSGVLPDDIVEPQLHDAWLRFEDPAAPIPHRVTELPDPPLVLRATCDATAVWRMLRSVRPDRRRPQWFVDVSELVKHDARSGIQRVVKNYLLELIADPPPGTDVVPVCATVEEPGYRVAEAFTLALAGIEGGRARGSLVEPRAGDTFFGLDLQPHVVPARLNDLRAMRARGVRLAFMVYDLLPIQLPDFFLPGAADGHAEWLKAVAEADLAIAISQSVADELRAWLARRKPEGPRPEIRWVHLGGDLVHSLPTKGLPDDAAQQLEAIARRPAFLMVGTLEPRKGHAQVLEAFERLWASGVDASLVICGRFGWLVEALARSIQNHPERGQRLFWIESPSDEYLDRLYAASACMILASHGEGFGLPLVEAARHGIPIIARDLPVFREVAGAHASYFSGDAAALAQAVRDWLERRNAGEVPASRDMPWLTWRESARRVRALIGARTDLRCGSAASASGERMAVKILDQPKHHARPDAD